MRFSTFRALASALMLAGIARPGVARAQRTDTLRVAGLTKPVELLRDRWGVAHIYATNEHDLFFAQGYASARDRARGRIFPG